MDLQAENERLKARVDDLLRANNGLLNRARNAEAVSQRRLTAILAATKTICLLRKELLRQ